MNYLRTLIKWINPRKEIEMKLLFRMSRDGGDTSTFHKLCDNKGPTLTLFKIEDGDIIGIYTPLEWDCSESGKYDIDTFIFNLNKNKKYKKIEKNCSAYCSRGYGPCVGNFGCKGKRIEQCCSLNGQFDNGDDILSNSQFKYFNLQDYEVFSVC